jgi:AcrR family transcriptional regulator
MTEKPVRRRAPGMSPDDRRAMIIATAIPLVAEHGTAVTTSQIAKAAGIGEATIFRVFTDKDELIDACMGEALRADHAVTQLASIPLDQPLEDRLAEASEALGAHLARIGAMAGALHSTGHRRGQPRAQPEPGSREASTEMIRDALADLLEPDRTVLRQSPEQVAEIFLGLLFSRRRGGPGEVPTAGLIDLFLHGAVKTA